MRWLLRVSLAVAKVGKGTENDKFSWFSKFSCFREWFSAGVNESPPKFEEIHRVGLSVRVEAMRLGG